MPFEDAGGWETCENCIRRMRALFAEDHRRDMRVIDDRGLVVASTDDPWSSSRNVVDGSTVPVGHPRHDGHQLRVG